MNAARFALNGGGGVYYISDWIFLTSSNSLVAAGRAASSRLRVFALKGLSLSVPSAKSVVQFFRVAAGPAVPLRLR